MNKKRILVTGATGFIGHHLIKNLRKNKNYEIFCLVRKPIQNKSVKLIFGDITDENSLKKIPSVDVVIHLAALKYHYFEKEDIYKVNVEGTKNILNNLKFNQLIFASTILAANPYDNYSMSKRMGEELIKKTRINYTILRFSPVFGKGDETNITKIIKIVKTAPIVPVIGKGKNLMQPIFVEDCVRVIESCILNKKTYKKTYFVVGKTMSLNELVENIEKAFDVKKIKIHLPIWLIKPFVLFYEKVSPQPFITMEQLKNYEREVVFHSKEIVKDLNFRPSPLVESIRKSI